MSFYKLELRNIDSIRKTMRATLVSNHKLSECITVHPCIYIYSSCKILKYNTSKGIFKCLVQIYSFFIVSLNHNFLETKLVVC